jgi:hypothetical protein
MLDLIVIIAAAGYTLGTGRTVPTLAAVVGLVSVILGGLSLLRPTVGKIGAPISMLLGLISLIVGGMHAAYAAGSLGTGNGLAGAIFAVALGLIGIALGGLAFTRSRTTS